MMTRALAIISVLSCFLVAAFGEKAFSAEGGAQGGLVIEDAWAPPTLDGANVGVAFARLVNTGSTDIEIVGMETDIANIVELHDHIMQDGKMVMRKLPKVLVPAQGEILMKSGGLHLMLIDLTRSAKDGETITIHFTPKDAQPQSIAFEVSQARLIEALKSRKQGHAHH